MKRKKKILFAAVDIGYRIEHYTKFIHENYSEQLIPESFSKFVLPTSHYKTQYTYSCEVKQKHRFFVYLYCFCFFIFSLFRYDILHFISGETILTRKLRRFELFVYKLLGKRVIMHFVGSDIRSQEFIYWKDKNIQHFLTSGSSVEKNLPWQKQLIADTEKYADVILVSSPDLRQFLKNAVYYPVVLDLKKFIAESNPVLQRPATDEIVILHAPSNTSLKGTAHIHATLKKLAGRLPYTIKLILPGEHMIGTTETYPITRYELFETYKQADIVIDQLIIGWYGLQSIEALLMGKEVISYIDKELEADLFPNCPIELANVNTLEEVIIKCIEKILANKKNSYSDTLEWVKKYHTIEKNFNPLIAAWGITAAKE